jgi:anti-sigma regulatory factor (Ser/Thr protein kinase)
VASNTCLQLTLPAVPGSIRTAREAAASSVVKSARGQRLADDVRLCVSEAVTNVVRHAYGRGTGEVDVVVERDDGAVSVVVRDRGKGMTKAERDGRIGGFGLKIIEKVADRSRIRSTPDSGVEVEMVFNETSQPRPS